MIKSAITAFGRIAAFTLVLMLILGFAIPSLEALVTMEVDGNSANGSPVTIGKIIYGSEYLAEAFNQSFFFQPRPSATGYNFSYSGVSNYTIDNSRFINQTVQNIRLFEEKNPGINISQIPFTQIVISGSGVDPDIPLQAAYLQLPRVADNLTVLLENKSHENSSYYSNLLKNLISENTAQNFPLFGSDYVNVIQVDFVILQIIVTYEGQSFLDK
ncbi:MAG: potassium-transporting ATPase subunit C [Candidatus Thermoplasmatota archaeon]|nr:potassium-transporting ATPase subunit C [Candidatus Thermoplasmatota archaeon]MCL5730870.1 potassium-transporting ATPase subunit C [Candidatus Thermoplasmatota archaeon]